jgi:hypothetical protein
MCAEIMIATVHKTNLSLKFQISYTSVFFSCIPDSETPNTKDGFVTSAYCNLHNKPKAEVLPGHKLTGPKEEEEDYLIILPYFYDF